MDNKFFMGRISGFPVYVDPTFLLLAAIWMMSYLTRPTAMTIAIGLAVTTGIALSILLHELAHAYAGRYFGTRVNFVELNGMGGLCHYASALPGNPWARIAISIAGPAVNMTLYHALNFSAELGARSVPWHVTSVLITLAYANWWLFVFNMLPAFPLDGGQALRDWLGIHMPGLTATRIVAVLGMIVCVGVVLYALQAQAMFLGLIALFIGLVNWKAYNDASRPPWQRWQ